MSTHSGNQNGYAMTSDRERNSNGKESEPARRRVRCLTLQTEELRDKHTNYGGGNGGADIGEESPFKSWT